MSNSQRRNAIEYIASRAGVSEQQAAHWIDQLDYRHTNNQLELKTELPNQIVEEQMLQLLYAAINSAHEMVIITDARPNIGDEQIIYVNKGVERVSGYSRKELIGENPKIFQGPKTDRKTINRLRKRLTAGKHVEGETFNYRKDGSKYRVRWSIDPIRDEAGDITHFISVQQDVTDEWEQKKKLEQMVEERESLLSEIHHRVKNNLAVIAGLLELQSAQSDSRETQKILGESMNRIQSIATLHEKLYETGDYDNIHLPEYIDGLLQHLIKTMDPGHLDLTIHKNIDDVSLSVNKAVSLALVLNELVTNSFKHGFENRDQGGLWISLNRSSDLFILEVEDDGVGLPDDLKIDQLQSLGLRLIDTLCEQLEGEYTLENREPGTRFRLEFKSSD